jgi:hypothetical protein
VALYESTPGAIYKSIAADLGVNRAILREWALRDRERRGITAGVGKPGVLPRAVVPSADPDERVRQLEARATELVMMLGVHVSVAVIRRRTSGGDWMTYSAARSATGPAWRPSTPAAGCRVRPTHDRPPPTIRQPGGTR